MPKILIVAEKPDVGRTLAAALLGRTFSGVGPHRGTLATGEELTVACARGHLFELAAPEVYDPKYGAWNVHDLPIVPPGRWEFQQAPREDAGSYIRTLREQVAEHLGGEIVNACDAGREGEVIFRKVMRGCGARKGTTYTRMWAQVMTEDGLREAFAQRSPSSGYNGLAEAGFSRDEGDWLVGMNVTVLATKTLPRGQGKWKVWSVGRVQTPTLALVDARDRLIADFKPQPFWEAYARFGDVEAKAELDAYADSPDRPKLLGSPEVNTERSKKVFWSEEKGKAFAAAAREPATYAVNDKKTTRTEKPPLPFDLQEVQKLCSRRLGLTGTESLGILQDLYEKRKLLSYPRTDSRHLPTKLKGKLHADLARVLEELRRTHPKLHLVSQEIMPAEVAARSRAFDDSKVSDHFGIVPTGEIGAIAELAGHERFVFLAVVQMTLMALDEAARYKAVTRRYTQVGAQGPYAPAIFRTTREELEFAGFTRWRKEDPDPKRSRPLPPSPSDQARIDEVTLKQLQTSPPQPYTDATLLDAMKYAGESFDPELNPEQVDAMIEVMKDRGIGTPATRAGIIDKLVARQFLERQGKNIVTTENGRQLIRELRERAPDFLSAQLTAEWELVLKQMERGQAKLSREQFLDALLEQVVKLKSAFLARPGRPVDDRPAIPVTEGTPVEGAVCPKSGTPLLDRGPYFEAAGFPGLKLWKRAFGRDFSAAEYVEFLKACVAGAPFPAKGLASAKGRTFDAELVLGEDGTKIVFHQPEPKKVKGVKCPQTGKLLLDHGNHFEAAGWPGVRLYKQAFGRAFTAEDYVPILEGWKAGAPIVVTGLVSTKSGKTYSAKLVVDAVTKKVKLDFGERAA